MRSAVWVGGPHFRIEERPTPEPGPGEVRVRVHACGVCLTDVHTVDGLLRESQPPREMGHEFGGTVEALGPGVHDLEVGTPVVATGAPGYADQAIVAAARAFPLPRGVPLEHAVFAEPIVCCATAVEQAALPLGAAVLLTGAGPMGLLTLQLAKHGGATRALVSDPNPARRELARRMGADEVVDPLATDLQAAVQAFTRGRGVDVAFECAGRPEPLQDCIAAVTRQGTVVMVGVNSRTSQLELKLHDFHFRFLKLIGSYGGPNRGGFRAATQLLGQLDLAPLISHRYELAEIETAFEVARTGQGAKVLVGGGLA